MTYSEIVSFLWSIADLIRDSFRRGEYQNDSSADRSAPSRLRFGCHESARPRSECETARQAHVPDAWINESVRDHKDGAVGKIGYEINFNRDFYKYQPPRPLEDIQADLKTVEQEILAQECIRHMHSGA
jgi:hypothetical protein